MIIHARGRIAVVLACLTFVAIGQEAKTPPAPVTLEEVVVSSDHERQRQKSPEHSIPDPDLVTVFQDGTIRIRLQPRNPQRRIYFRRASDARSTTESMHANMQLNPDVLTALDGTMIDDVVLELAPDIDGSDGLPALLPFGPHVSLVNMDYARLRDTEHPTLTYVNNAVHPQSRRCEARFGAGDDEQAFVNRFILLADSLDECRRAAESREGDLIFADDVPEQLRQELREIYEPLYNRFVRELGSEPGNLFVAWRPASPHSDFRFEQSWPRNSLLLFNGPAWQRGLDPEQRDTLWANFALEQIRRRLLRPGRAPDAITQSAVIYLFLLASSERQHATSRWLATALPTWIVACARDLNERATREKSRQGTALSQDCGRVLHFVYDAVARAKSKGEDTVDRTWRGLLAASFRRGESGVDSGKFIASSDEARRIVRGLQDGSMDWPRFAAELEKQGVRLRLTVNQPGLAVEVLSLVHFHD